MKQQSYLRTLKSFLVAKDYRILSFLLGLILLTSIIELAGVGSLFPYIKLLGDPTLTQNSHWLNHFYTSMNFQSQQQFEIFLGGMIFGLVVLKGVMSVVNNYSQARFSKKLSMKLTKSCLRSFFKMPYINMLDKNSASLSKHVLIDIDCVVQVFTAVLAMTTDIIVTSALIALMLWVNMQIILASALSLILAMYVMFRVTRGSLHRISKENERFARFLYKNINCALQGVKDIKVHQAEGFFSSGFLYWKNKMLANRVNYTVISNMPAIVMNVLGFGVLMIVLLMLLYKSGNLAGILPTIGIVAVAIQRLLPAVGRMSTSLGTIRQYKQNVMVVKEAIDKLKSYEQEDENLESKPLKLNNTLRFENVTFKYPSRDQATLSSVSLAIHKHQSLGIVGASGAGKSTLLDVLLGLLPVASGKIYCDDIDITHRKSALFNLVGYVPQQPFLLDASIKENIAFGLQESEISESMLQEVVEISQLKELVDELPEGVNTIVGEKGVKISGGQRQRIGIARALYKNPEILIMDEATSSLDSVTEKKINLALDSIQKHKTLVIIAHRLTSVKFCKSIAVIENGCLISYGTHETLASSCHVYKDLYKENLRAEALTT